GMNYNLWVQRINKYGIPRLAPSSTLVGTDPAIYGWPQKTTDRASAHVPYMSDECFSGFDGSRGGTNIADINITGAGAGYWNGVNDTWIWTWNKISGHVYGHSLASVNLVFADGHVDSHNKQAIKCVYMVATEDVHWPGMWFQAGTFY